MLVIKNECVGENKKKNLESLKQKKKWKRKKSDKSNRFMFSLLLSCDQTFV